MPSIIKDQDPDHRLIVLLVIALSSVLLWQTTIGSLLLYPFTILATWFHEMGHGMAAMLLGRSFERLLIFSDGSGVAVSLRPADASRLGDAIVSASGPLGPAIAGSAMIVASRTKNATRTALIILGTALVVSSIIWVRSWIGWFVLPALGAAILAVALRGSLLQRRFTIQLLGVQACISVWQHLDYLFSAGGDVGGALRRSDTAAMADALLLPFWFWGAAITGAVCGLLWWSISSAVRR